MAVAIALWGALMGFAVGITVSGYFWSRLCDDSIAQTTEAQDNAFQAIAQYDALQKIHATGLVQQLKDHAKRRREKKDA